MKNSLNSSDYQLVQTQNQIRKEQLKKPMTGIKIAKFLTEHHQNNKVKSDSSEVSSVNRVEKGEEVNQVNFSNQKL